VSQREPPALALERIHPMSALIRPFGREDEPALRRVMAAALEVDAYPGFNAWDLDHEALSMVGAPESVAVAVEGDVLCGYVSPGHEDLTVHPEFRRRGHGRRLFAAGLELAAEAGWDEVRLYVPLGGVGQAFARAMGMTYRSSMWRLDLAPGTYVPEPAFSADVVARTFGDWLPLQALVDLLNAAFVDHASPLSWTLAQIQYAHDQPDFDPTTTMLVSPTDRPADPVAFGRIALLPPQEGELAPVSEFRLVGVLPQWRGRGLGRELLRWGVAQLRERGAGRIKLSVEAENELALGLYRRTGFEPTIEWPHWASPVATRDRQSR
jgi:mycothiol synthase